METNKSKGDKMLPDICSSSAGLWLRECNYIHCTGTCI